MFKILHIINNDKKFFPFIKLTFTSSLIDNYFIKDDEFENQINNKNYDCIIIHFLSYKISNIINKNQFNIKIIWFFWGNDAFDLNKIKSTIYLPKTKKKLVFLTLKNNPIKGIKIILRLFFPSLMDKKKKYKNKILSFKKIFLIVPVVPGDIDILKDNYSINCLSFHMNYINPIFKKKMALTNLNQNILIGNSASFSNNHIEMIDKLAKINLNNKKIYIPLSYGNKKYAEYISKYAHNKLGENVISLFNFINTDEYNKLLNSCKYVFMNHLRQQALGTIMQCILNGSHIYLNTNSTISLFLKSNGIKFSNIENIKNLESLDVHTVNSSKKICEKIFGVQTQQKKIKELIKIINC